ncbi:hypothetical protein [Mucilaginibacter arboris]|uniref:Uncharacterized protein n=1 Tax=Mucilaginibacter arboris TaxID=2682090 RepID=A0A7K1SXY0_9SPHI|nr:hypothetical protein [Mucilaginibacter arboris]MVN22107.1 hypothetical protein [Mucilaginibacter arboris]
MNGDNDNPAFLKRYRLLITLVIILLVLAVGCWLVKKRGANRTDERKDRVLQQLDQRKK